MDNEVMYEVNLNFKGTFFVDATSEKEAEEKARKMLCKNDRKELVYTIVNSINYDYKIQDIKEVF